MMGGQVLEFFPERKEMHRDRGPSFFCGMLLTKIDGFAGGYSPYLVVSLLTMTKACETRPS